MPVLPAYLAVLYELRPRFKNPTERYAGLVVPAGDGLCAAEILRDQPNYSVVTIDTTEVLPAEYIAFGHDHTNELTVARNKNLEEFTDRCIQLRLSLRQARERLQGRKFHFLVWDSTDWNGVELAFPMVRPRGLVMLREPSGKWELR